MVACYPFLPKNDKDKDADAIAITNFIKIGIEHIDTLKKIKTHTLGGIRKRGGAPLDLSMSTFSLSKDETSEKTIVCPKTVLFDQNNIHELMGIIREYDSKTFYKIVASAFNINKYFWEQVKNNKEIKIKTTSHLLKERGVERANHESWVKVLPADTSEIDEDICQVKLLIHEGKKYITILSSDGEGGTYESYYNIGDNGIISFAKKNGNMITIQDPIVPNEDTTIINDINAILAQCDEVIKSAVKLVAEHDRALQDKQ